MEVQYRLLVQPSFLESEKFLESFYSNQIATFAYRRLVVLGNKALAVAIVISGCLLMNEC